MSRTDVTDLSRPVSTASSRKLFRTMAASRPRRTACRRRTPCLRCPRMGTRQRALRGRLLQQKPRTARRRKQCGLRSRQNRQLPPLSRPRALLPPRQAMTRKKTNLPRTTMTYPRLHLPKPGRPRPTSRGGRPCWKRSASRSSEVAVRARSPRPLAGVATPVGRLPFRSRNSCASTRSATTRLSASSDGTSA